MYKQKKVWYITAAVIVVAASAFAYVGLTRSDEQEAEAVPLQAATVRQGDIIVSASGAGELIPATEIEVSFQSGGLLTSIEVQVGEVVEEGQLLAQLDDSSERIAYAQAERTLLELTSITAVAEANQAVAEAQDELEDSYNLLKYYVSSSVVYWEEKVEEAQEALDLAQADDQNSSTDETRKAVEDAERLLNTAERSLNSAWYAYEETYIEQTFTVEECEQQGRKQVCEEYISAPSQTTIDDARWSYEVAQLEVIEAEYLLAALTEGEIPEGAIGDGIAALESAQLNFQTAKNNLEATKLYAPISGTIMSIAGQVGELVGTSPIITVADLDQALLQIYLDETDFDKIDLDYEVEVVFDIYPDDVFIGYVAQVDPQLVTVDGVAAVSALVALDESAGPSLKKLLIGSNASVEVIAGRAEGVLLVPVEALRQISPDEYAVFVVEDGEPEMRMVEVGLMDLTYAEITSGLAVGDLVSTGIVETE
jgi:multidrug efflux pump subunit AcrA (membrane-fusion protein)